MPVLLCEIVTTRNHYEKTNIDNHYYRNKVFQIDPPSLERMAKVYFFSHAISSLDHPLGAPLGNGSSALIGVNIISSLSFVFESM